MKKWTKMVLSDKLKETDSLLSEFSVLRILFVLRYPLQSLNVRKPVSL